MFHFNDDSSHSSSPSPSYRRRRLLTLLFPLGIALVVTAYLLAGDVIFLSRSNGRDALILHHIRNINNNINNNKDAAAAASVRSREPSCSTQLPYVDFMFNQSEYFPQQTSVSSSRIRDALAAQLHADLRALQFDNAQCHNGSSMIVSALPGYGMSAVLLYQPRIFSFALHTRRTYVAQGLVAGASAANRSLCPEADFSCVYEPFSGCPSTNPPDSAMRSHPARESFVDQWPAYSIPERYRSQGWFWWIAHTLNYIVRPNERLQALVANAKRQLRWEHPMIVMHVRRSDSCRTRATCKPLSEYFDAARRMSAQYGPLRNVYVATDGSEVIEELRSGVYDAEFDIRYLDWDRSGFDWMKNHDPSVNIWLEPCHEAGKCDGIADMFSMAVDYELIADGDYHIGLFTSGALRVPYALSYARKGCLTPYVSLDVPFCWAWGSMLANYHGFVNLLC
jgi:hypothetical protein